MFKNLPLTARSLQATESRLQAIYNAASLGVKGDSLALAAGMLPTEYRRLREMDPLVEVAEVKGRADAEIEYADILRAAARNGDAKAALEILKHKFDWVAKQQVQVDVTQQISVIGALEKAQARVIEGKSYVIEPQNAETALLR
ncbi:MAG: hypothetical protein ACR2K1_03830 [Saprospiraceae bacterium]